MSGPLRAGFLAAALVLAGPGAARAAADPGRYEPPTAGEMAYGYTAVIKAERGGVDGLHLVDPDGGERRVGGVPDGSRIDDISSDAGRISTSLVTSESMPPSGTSYQSMMYVWDTDKGTASYFDNASYPAFTGFITDGVAEVYRLDDPTRPGDPETRVTPRGHDGTARPEYEPLDDQQAISFSPRGSLALHSTRSGVAIREAATGTVRSTVPTPDGFARCAPKRMWSAGTFLMDCSGAGEQGLFSVNMDSGKATALGHAGATAWNTSPKRLSQSGVDCPKAQYVDGESLRPLPIEAASSTVIGAWDSTAYLLTKNCDNTEVAVAKYDIASNTLTPVTGHGSANDRGRVLDAMTVDGWT